MFTYKFVGLEKEDAPTPYYYGSVPAKPERGQTLVYNETGNRYVIVLVEGEGLVDDGDGYPNQRELAWADINRGERVPTLTLQKIAGGETRPQGRSWDAEEVKKFSQTNRAERLSKSA
jgi:hypothetical protein